MIHRQRRRGHAHPIVLAPLVVVLIVFAAVWLALRPPNFTGGGAGGAASDTGATRGDAAAPSGAGDHDGGDAEQSSPPAPARDVDPPAAAPIEPAEARSAMGLHLTLSAGELTDHRVARVPALYVPAGEAVSPMLPPGPFTATFTGQLHLELRSRLTFTYRGAGRFKLTIGGATLLDVEGEGANVVEGASERVRLNGGAHAIEAVYTAPASGDAHFRLFWQSSDFPIDEPIPPTVLTYDASDVALRAAARWRRGRALIAEHRCFRCHAPGAIDFAAGMPELAHDAPVLVGAGSRLKAGWMRAWVLDPKAHRATAQMPRLLHGAEAARDASDIAAYLAEQRTPEAGAAPPPVADDGATIERGGALYAALGCVGCHAIDGADVNATDPPRIDLGHVARKFHPPALRAFLLQPSKWYASVGMANFKLSFDEADALVAFLLDRAAPVESAGASAVGDAARGAERFGAIGCANCHGMAVTNTFTAPGFDAVRRSGWTGGCLATDAEARGAAPDLALTDADREALIALANTDFASLGRRSMAEYADRQVAALRCVACHRHDGRTDHWTILAGEVERYENAALVGAAAHGEGAEGGEGEGGALDQTRPQLTRVGERLRTPWMAQFIEGEVDAPIRPWLTARMPAFTGRGQRLADGLAMQHGLAPQPAPRAARDDELAALGRQLAAKEGGFGCTDCHGVGAMKPTAVFEAQGINLAYVAERLHRDWYHRWMLNPQRYEPNTKMPRYADDYGGTTVTDVLEGEARKQFEALWQYLRGGREIQPPSP